MPEIQLIKAEAITSAIDAATAAADLANVAASSATDYTIDQVSARHTYPSPLSLTTQVSAGTFTVSGAQQISGGGNFRALTITGAGSMGEENVAGVKTNLSFDSTQVIRAKFNLNVATISNPSIGVLFGDTTVKGVIWRTNGQALTLTLLNTNVGSAGASTQTYTTSDTIEMDARVTGGSAGNYTLLYTFYKNGVSVATYTITGVETLDVWFGVRSGATWTASVNKHAAPNYFGKFFTDNLPASATRKTVYVATNGNDANPGTKASPFATVTKALEEIEGNGSIELASGDYRESISLSSITGTVEIRAELNKSIKLFGSTQLSLTKTGGYTQVYQAALASKPTGLGGGRGEPMIFEWGTPSKPVLDAERHSLQMGRSFRLPYTEMLEAASIAELDTVGGRGKWFWQSGTIYLSATDGDDATLKRYETRANTIFSGGGSTSGGTLILRGIDLFFSSGNGADFTGLVSVYRERCRAFGCYRNGFADNVPSVVTYFDECGGNGNDGVNGTMPTGWESMPDPGGVIEGIYFDPWFHDNYDDGISYHARGKRTIYGGLCEYNTKAGVIDVNGASIRCYNTVSRRNVNGFYVATPDTSNGRSGTIAECHGCIATNNTYNYRSSDSGMLMTCFNCVSRDATTYGYFLSNSGVLIAVNSRHSGGTAYISGVQIVTDTILS